jgi:hypothetical protein
MSCVHVLVVRPSCGQRGFGDPKADGGMKSYGRKKRYGSKLISELPHELPYELP